MVTKDGSEEVRAAVREQYGALARGDSGGCAPAGCCTPSFSPDGSRALGYSEEELGAVPDGANLGLGCGNPQTIAQLQAGETVLDLGAGGGFDCFLAARQVGPSGRVIGVDMTAEMVAKARANAAKLEAKNVEFRLGEIEHLPVGDASVDVIISNCVLNLSPDKLAVVREAFRVLKPAGRIAISDVVQIGTLPAHLQEQIATLTGCVSGAITAAAFERHLQEAGFEGIAVRIQEDSHRFIRDWLPGSGVEDYVRSASIEAVKPGARSRSGSPSIP